MGNSNQYDRIVLPPEDNYVNPVGVKHHDGKFTLTQGASTIVLTRSMLHEITEIQTEKVCDV